jgi:hypothetical protein
MSRALLAVLVLLASTHAGAQDQCRQGCPCGEACISCEDECHADDLTGADPATNNGTVIAIIVVTSAIAVVGLAAAAVLYFVGGQPSAPTSTYGEADGSPPRVDGLTPEGERVLYDCANRKCGTDAACRKTMYGQAAEAASKREYFIARGCIAAE